MTPVHEATGGHGFEVYLPASLRIIDVQLNV